MYMMYSNNPGHDDCTKCVSLMQMVALELFTAFNCFPVFLGSELKERYYKGRSHVISLQKRAQVYTQAHAVYSLAN